MNKLLGYLSFRGRSNRARFWLTNVTVYVAFLVGALIAMMLSELSPLISLVFLPVLAGILLAAIANSARRLHDRNKSAWWLILFAIVPAFFSLFAAAGPAAGGTKEATDFIELLGAPFSIWGLVEMGFLKGSPGPNKYGDDPLQTTSEVFA